MSVSYQQKTSTFRQLHQGPPILVLPNAGDVLSAKIFSALGFPAIATTSAGVANCLGYPDRENIPLDEMLFMIKKIVDAVDLQPQIWKRVIRMIRTNYRSRRLL